jgi:hypothetical protein
MYETMYKYSKYSDIGSWIKEYSVFRGRLHR